MVEVLLFHHAQGLTSGVLGFADELRQAGHVVHTPDLFEGQTFETVDEGVTFANAVGFDQVIERGVQAADGLARGPVYAGFSLGVMPAQKLAQTRSGARGALFFESCVPASYFADRWPANVPVQIHGMDADPFFVGEGDVDAARELVESAERAELFLYSGNKHLFADIGLASYDAGAAELLKRRVLEFLGTV